MACIDKDSTTSGFSCVFVAFQMVIGLFSGGVSAAATLSIVAVVVYGARLTIFGQMTTGTLTAFILYSLTGLNALFYLE